MGVKALSVSSGRVLGAYFNKCQCPPLTTDQRPGLCPEHLPSPLPVPSSSILIPALEGVQRSLGPWLRASVSRLGSRWILLLSWALSLVFGRLAWSGGPIPAGRHVWTCAASSSPTPLYSPSVGNGPPPLPCFCVNLPFSATQDIPGTGSESGHLGMVPSSWQAVCLERPGLCQWPCDVKSCDREWGLCISRPRFSIPQNDFPNQGMLETHGSLHSKNSRSALVSNPPGADVQPVLSRLLGPAQLTGISSPEIIALFSQPY